MKKFKSYPLFLTLGILATYLLAACSSSHSDLYSLASSDDTLIMTGNMESVLENADCMASAGGIQLSTPLQRIVSMLSPRDKYEVGAVLEIKGIDLKHTLLTMSQNNDLIFAFKISNMSDFKQFVNERSGGNLQLTKDGEYECYRFDPNTALYLLPDKGILLHSELVNADAKFLEQRLARAKSKPLENWQQSSIEEGKTLNVLAHIPTINTMIRDVTGADMLNSEQVAKFYDIEQLKNGYFTIDCSLEDLDLDINCAVVDNKGKNIPTKLASNTPDINTSLLKYATEKDYLVAMASVPQSMDWNNVLNDVVDMMGGPGMTGIDATTTAVLSMLLSDLNGTVMLAAGPQSVMKMDHLYGWHAVVAAEMKDGKASHYIDLLKGFIDANNQEKLRVAQEYKSYGWNNYEPLLIETNMFDGELQISIPDEGTLYAKAMDNVFVAALSPISTKGGCKISGSDFKKAMMGLVVDVPKDNAFSTVMNFPFGCNVAYVSDANGVKLRARQTETDGKFLNNLFELISGETN